MDLGDTGTNDDLDGILHALDEADAAVRAMYRQLAGDPDLAGECEPKLKELHGRRLDLAQRVGLVVLARRRASAHVEEAPTEPTPAVAEPVVAGANGATVEPESKPEPEPEPTSDDGPPASVPANGAQVAQWKSKVRTTGLGAGMSAAPSTATASAFVLHELMETVGPPRSLEASVGIIDEVDALNDVATDDKQALWARLTKNTQQLWLSMLVARTRALKNLASVTPEMKSRVKVIISRYPPWAKEHAPGHVNGMQAKHEPMNGSWAQDARDDWDALNRLLGEEPVVRSPGAPKKKPKRTERDDDGPEIDPAWRLLPTVRGRKAIIVGGDPREPNRERLERAFQLASLEWPPIDGPRKVDAIAERIHRGTYDIVLVLQPYVAHKQSNAIIEAAKESAVPWALVEGYGVSAVKLGLERFLGGPRSGASLPHADDDDGQDAMNKGRG
jgi:hypothetical protein